MTETHYRRRSLKNHDVIRGKDRSGLQGPRGSLTDIDLAERTNPRLERPAVMIETIMFVAAREGADPAEAMTAKSHALYEYLMASARVEMEDNPGQEFHVPFSAAKSYLGIDRTDRLREYVAAINATMVTYDFRIDGYQRSGVMPLLLCDYSRSEQTGEQYIVYSMHRAVQQVILNARRYALLELNAFRKFTSKYTARLYPRLALLAGQNVRPPLEIAPQELAAQLGWMPEKFHWGNFMNRVLEPILDDLSPAAKEEPAVRMFSVEMNLKRGSGRGSPVEMIEFLVTPNAGQMRQMRAATLRGDDAHWARRHIDGLAPEHSPAVELVAQAVTKTDRTVTSIRGDWADTVKTLMAPAGAGHRLRAILNERGVGEAFAKWVDDFGAEPVSIELTEEHDTVPPVVEEQVLLPSKEERMKAHAMDVAYRAAKMANNMRPATHGLPEVTHFFSDDHIRTYADGDMWIMLESACVTEFAVIQKAFGLMSRQEPIQMRKSVYNLAGALSDWNIPQAVSIARAVIANHKPAPVDTKKVDIPEPTPKVYELEDEEIPF